MIGVVIKGRLSLNELRYKQCFQLRATKYLHSVKDFDPLNLVLKLPTKSTDDLTKSENLICQTVIEEFHWLKNDTTIKGWLESIENKKEARPNETDYWK